MVPASEPAPAPGPAAGDPGRVAELEDAWAARVRASREQAERVRDPGVRDSDGPPGSPVVADPRRTDEPVLAVLDTLARPGSTWLDIGAGAGRYALPLALRVREVIAVEPSAAMRHALRAGLGEHGIGNVRVVPGAWPAAIADLLPLPAADVALIAHVGYEVEEIGPFLDAMEAAAGERCVAVLTDRSPGAIADPLWPLVHREVRRPLPCLPDLLELLAARGRQARLVRVDRQARRFDSLDALGRYLRRQLLIADSGAKAARLRAILPGVAARHDGAWTLADHPAGAAGIVSWLVPGR